MRTIVGVFCFLLGFIEVVTAQTPSLGTYSNATIMSNGNASFSPTIAPQNTASLTATTNPNFKGTLLANPLTGKITVINAYPAGVYLLSIKAFAAIGSATATTSFTLTVSNTQACSLAAFTYNGSAINIGTRPLGVTLADFNNDGIQDMASVNFQSPSTVSIRLGNGRSFSGFTEVAVGDGARSLAVGDFNGDGNVDLAATSQTNSTVSIRLGNGLGTFSGTTEVPVANGVRSIAIADFNQDKKLDFVVACDNSDSAYIRLGNGQGGFIDSTEVPLPAPGLAVVVGDFNEDGFTDFACSSGQFGSAVYIRLGNGTGNFSGTININAGNIAKHILTADFNGDGHTDLALSNNNGNTVSILLGTGTGNFTIGDEVPVWDNPFQLALGDFNGDGKQDFAVGSESFGKIRVRLGNGAGGFTDNGTLNTNIEADGVAVGDFNSDGIQDIVSADGDNKLYVFLGNSKTLVVKGNGQIIADGDISPSTVDYTDFAAVEVNQTAQRSFILKNNGNTPLSIVAINRTGTNAAMFTVTGISFPASIAGQDSIVFTLQFTPTSSGIKTANVSIVTNDCVNPSYDFAVKGNAYILPVLGTYANTTVVYGGNVTINPSQAPQNTNLLTVTPSVNFKGKILINSTTGIIQVVNAQSKGTLEIKVRAYVDTSIASTRTFNLKVDTLNSCTYGHFETRFVYPTANLPKQIEVGDFNGDGKQDMIALCTTDSVLQVRLGDGAGNFGNIISTPIPRYATEMVLADFNADGKLDIAIAHSTSKKITVFFGSGSGSFTLQNTLLFYNTLNGLTVADFNNDGFLDLASTSSISQTSNDYIGIYLNNRAGGFVPQTDVYIGNVPLKIKALDNNNDGFVDLMVLASDVSKYYNGNGAGVFTLEMSIPLWYANTVIDVSLGDLELDGQFNDLALLYSAPASFGTTIVTADLFGSVAVSFPPLNVNNSPYTFIAGDFNGLGKYDFAVGSSLVDALQLYNGSGFNTYTYDTAIITNTRSTALASGDFNGDGLLDLLAADNVDNKVAVIMKQLDPARSIQVLGNNKPIVPATVITAFSDSTNFGTVTVQTTKTYTIKNTSTIPLTIYSITSSNSTFLLSTGSLGAYPSVLAPGQAGTFLVRFNPTNIGNAQSTIRVKSNACLNADYSFLVEATLSTSGAALGFDGVDDYVDIADAPVFNFSSGFTIEAWINVGASGNKSILDKVYPFGAGPFLFDLTNNLRLGIFTNSGPFFINAPTAISLNTWTHVAATYNPSAAQMKLFINGTEVAVGAIDGTIINNPLPIRIGAPAASPASTAFFNGKMDEVHIWNKALNSCEIKSHLNQKITTNMSGLVGNYAFNQGVAFGNNSTETILADASGNNNQGTLTNFNLTALNASNWISPGAVETNPIQLFNYWLGVNTNWNDALNWSTGIVPTASTNVCITNCAANMPIVTGLSSTCYKLYVQSGAQVTVETGAKLTVTGN
ncbi:MAG: FG-GAP-like repeat-containing protein [Ferruginibacter sp.]